MRLSIKLGFRFVSICWLFDRPHRRPWRGLHFHDGKCTFLGVAHGVGERCNDHKIDDTEVIESGKVSVAIVAMGVAE